MNPNYPYDLMYMHPMYNPYLLQTSMLLPNERDVIERKYNEQIQHLQQNILKEVSQNSKLMEEIQSINQQCVLEINQIKQQCVLEMDQIKQQYALEMDQIKQQCALETDQIKQQYALETDRIKQQHITNIEQMKQQHIDKNKDLKSTIEEQKQKIQVLQKSNTDFINKVKAIQEEKRKQSQAQESLILSLQNKIKELRLEINNNKSTTKSSAKPKVKKSDKMTAATATKESKVDDDDIFIQELADMNQTIQHQQECNKTILQQKIDLALQCKKKQDTIEHLITRVNHILIISGKEYYSTIRSIQDEQGQFTKYMKSIHDFTPTEWLAVKERATDIIELSTKANGCIKLSFLKLLEYRRDLTDRLDRLQTLYDQGVPGKDEVSREFQNLYPLLKGVMKNDFLFFYRFLIKTSDQEEKDILHRLVIEHEI